MGTSIKSRYTNEILDSICRKKHSDWMIIEWKAGQND